MFNKKTTETIQKLQIKVELLEDLLTRMNQKHSLLGDRCKDLEKRVWELEHPPKYALGDEVSVKVDMFNDYKGIVSKTWADAALFGEYIRRYDVLMIEKQKIITCMEEQMSLCL